MREIWESDRDFFKGIFVIEAIIFLMLMNFGVIAQPQVNMEIIKKIESNGNPRAIGEAGEVGLFQITPIVRKSYNKRTDHNYIRNDLFNPRINRKIARWYLTERIPQMLRAFNLEVTVKNIIWSYNAGINRVLNGFLPDITKQYIKKYRKRCNNG